MKKTKTKRIVLYGAAAFVVLVFSLYALFPSQRVKQVLVQRLKAELPPGLSVSIDRVNPRFPPGLALHSVALRERKENVVELSRLIVKPDLYAVFTKGKGQIYEGEAFSGTFHGHVRRNTSTEQRLAVKLIFSGFKLETIPALQDMPNMHIDGTATGSVTYRENMEGKPDGTGELEVTNGHVSLPVTILGAADIQVERLTVAWELTKGKLLIKNCDFKTRKLTGSVDGHIVIEQPVARSRLDLTAQVSVRRDSLGGGDENTVPAELRSAKNSHRHMELKITGTLASPMIR